MEKAGGEDECAAPWVFNQIHVCGCKRAICYISGGKKVGFLEERGKCVETDVGGGGMRGRPPLATVAVRHSGMLLQDKERGAFIEVCRTPLTRDKRPESELHYAAPSLRGLCQDGARGSISARGATVILDCRKPLGLPFKCTLYL